MTTTLSDMTTKKPEPSAEEIAAKELVRLAKEQGLSLTGPDGLLKQFTKNVLETALNEEMTEHLGHEKNRVPRAARPATSATGPDPRRCLPTRPGRSSSTYPVTGTGPSSVDGAGIDREQGSDLGPVEDLTVGCPQGRPGRDRGRDRVVAHAEQVRGRCRRGWLDATRCLKFTPMGVNAGGPAFRVDSRMDSRMELLGGHSEHHDF
ncbi:hypothetical protein BH09ACT11_BH09ACT11_16250 [soil metagenome]